MVTHRDVNESNKSYHVVPQAKRKAVQLADDGTLSRKGRQGPEQEEEKPKFTQLEWRFMQEPLNGRASQDNDLDVVHHMNEEKSIFESSF